MGDGAARAAGCRPQGPGQAHLTFIVILSVPLQIVLQNISLLCNFVRKTRGNLDDYLIKD